MNFYFFFLLLHILRFKSINSAPAPPPPPPPPQIFRLEPVQGGQASAHAGHTSPVAP